VRFLSCLGTCTQVRPGTEDEEDIEEKIQTVVCSDVRPGASPTGTGVAKIRGVVAEPDPEASLITDFQIITDIRVSLGALSWCVWSVVCCVLCDGNEGLWIEGVRAGVWGSALLKV